MSIKVLTVYRELLQSPSLISTSADRTTVPHRVKNPTQAIETGIFNKKYRLKVKAVARNPVSDLGARCEIYKNLISR